MNLRRFFAEADLARDDVVIWNAVPWVIHAPGAKNGAPSGAEISDGLCLVLPLLALLPRLAAVVLAGRVAAKAEQRIPATWPGLPVLPMPHPSPTIVCTSPTVPARIAQAVKEARLALGGNGCRAIWQTNIDA